MASVCRYASAFQRAHARLCESSRQSAQSASRQWGRTRSDRSKPLAAMTRAHCSATPRCAMAPPCYLAALKFLGYASIASKPSLLAKAW